MAHNGHVEGEDHQPNTPPDLEDVVVEERCASCSKQREEDRSWGFGHDPLHPRLRASWWPRRWQPAQNWLAEKMESRAAHWTIIVLTLFDLAVVMTEIILSSFYCSDDKPHAVHVTEEVLSYISIGVLSLFTLDQLMRLLVFGPRYFTRNAWHTFDAAVIVTSLVLESVLKGVTQEVVSLLIVFRMWRLVRVTHGVAEEIRAGHAVELERHHEEMAELRRLLREERARCAALRTRLGEPPGDEGSSQRGAGATDGGGGGLAAPSGRLKGA